MINSVSSVGMNKNYRTSFKGESSVVEQQHRETKDGMSNSQKTLIGLGAAAALVIGGLMVKRHLDSKPFKDILAPNFDFNLEKTHEFSKDFLENNVISKWSDEFKLETGDALYIVQKSKFEEFIQNLKISDIDKKGFKDMNMSDNGLAVFLMKADGTCSSVKFFDPETITYPRLIDAIKNNKIYKRDIRVSK